MPDTTSHHFKTKGDAVSNSTQHVKPSKPYPDFPLFAHATKRWAKKIRGKFVYFGRWDDPDAALQKYLDQKDDLHAGRTPRIAGDGLTVADLCNSFLNSKRSLLDTGEIVDRTFGSYFASCENIVQAFGRDRLIDDLVCDDFARLRDSLAGRLGPVALGIEISKIRMVFKFGFDQGVIDKPLRYGQSFNRPSRKVLRVARNKSGKRMFEPYELRAILDAATQPLKAMTLLGLNCGFGNTDVASLLQSAIDFESGWIEYPRPKTGIERRIPLWTETIAAVQEAIDLRPIPKDASDADLCFLTQRGNPWVRMSVHENPEKRTAIDSVANEYLKLLKRLGINGRKGLGFYALRHVFETIGGESKDQVAVNALMGHVDSSMAGMYRERISDERLKAVTETVRDWLWQEGGAA